MNEVKLTAYRAGYLAGWGNEHDNPYVELSPEWVEYEKGWEEGDTLRLQELLDSRNE